MLASHRYRAECEQIALAACVLFSFLLSLGVALEMSVGAGENLRFCFM